MTSHPFGTFPEIHPIWSPIDWTDKYPWWTNVWWINNSMDRCLLDDYPSRTSIWYLIDPAHHLIYWSDKCPLWKNVPLSTNICHTDRFPLSQILETFLFIAYLRPFFFLKITGRKSILKKWQNFFLYQVVLDFCYGHRMCPIWVWGKGHFHFLPFPYFQIGHFQCSKSESLIPLFNTNLPLISVKCGLRNHCWLL